MSYVLGINSAIRASIVTSLPDLKLVSFQSRAVAGPQLGQRHSGLPIQRHFAFIDALKWRPGIEDSVRRKAGDSTSGNVRVDPILDFSYVASCNVLVFVFVVVLVSLG